MGKPTNIPTTAIENSPGRMSYYDTIPKEVHLIRFGIAS
jgi:hypothetical protein